MRFSLSILGTEVLCIDTGSNEQAEDEWDDQGSVTSNPVGFCVNDPAPFEYDVPPHVEEC